MYHFNINFFFLVFVIFLLNIFLFFKYEKISKIFNLLDTNNNNKILKINGYPVGGVILFVNIFILFLANYFFNVDIFNIRGEQLFFFFITCLFLFLLGVCDDKFNLSPYQKFLFLFLIFYFLIFFDNSIQIVELRFDVISYTVNLGLFSKFFTILFLLMFLNAFNMFDGINLQSGLYSFLVIFVFLIFIKKINIYYFILLFLIIFLYWNCRKNVFLGNSGSLLIPFIISYYFIKFYNDNTIAFVDEIYIYMCIPGLDMFRLFVNRIIKKKNPFRGDLFHIHHLILKKSSYLQSLSIIQLFLILTLLSGYLISLQISIFFSLVIYLYLLHRYS